MGRDLEVMELDVERFADLEECVAPEGADAQRAYGDPPRSETCPRVPVSPFPEPSRAPLLTDGCYFVFPVDGRLSSVVALFIERSVHQ